ncbi:unnamed protein product [Symbiodinium sp. CCMP2456]|nr:unnamed protein product [Symbiodinium sp. CCMP2456]
MAEYDSIASQALSDDQKVVSLLRCLTGQLRQHVNLTMEDSWTYAELRGLVARYDASSSKWSASVAATYGLSEGKGGVLINAPVEDSTDQGASASSEAAPAAPKAKTTPKAQVRRVAYNLDDFDESFDGSVRMVSRMCSDEGNFPSAGRDNVRPAEFFQDAQGNPLMVHGTRRAELSYGDQPAFTETFLVAPHIGTPLLAVGKLYRAGFSLRNEDGRMSLCSPNGDIQIPLYLKQNSLAAKLHVRVIQQDPQSVRALKCTVGDMELPDHFVQLQPDVFGMRSHSNRFVDITMALPREGCSFRSTVAKASGSDEWEILEWCESIVDVDELSALLPGGNNHEVIVFATRKVVAPDDVGLTVVGDEGPTGSSGLPAPPADDADMVGSEPQHHDAVDPDKEAELQVDAAMRDEVPADDDGSLMVDGVSLSLDSTLSVLRQAAQSLGLGRSGGKSTVLKRIKDHLTRQSLLAAHQAREHLASTTERVPQEQKPVVPPSEEERRLHSLTHTPFREWCSHCASYRSKSDRHEARTGNARTSSVLCYDFCFTNRLEKEEKLCCLVCHDSDTKWIQAWPVSHKGGTSARNYLSVEIAKLLSYLGHRRITLRADPEPACSALGNAIQSLRSVRRTTCKYDPSLVEALRDTPEQHVSFLAGRVGASRNQLRPKQVETEEVGSGSEVAASDPPTENEDVIDNPHDIAPAPSSVRLPGESASATPREVAVREPSQPSRLPQHLPPPASALVTDDSPPSPTPASAPVCRPRLMKGMVLEK